MSTIDRTKEQRMNDNAVPAVIDSDMLPAVVSRPNVASERTANVLSLISKGMETGATPEAMTQLVALYERVMAKDAEAQFLEAKRAFQAECPVIGKNREAKLGEGKANYRFADLEKITRVIRPLLEAHGFSYDFAQEYDKEVVTVTCFLRHAAGHVEATKFSGPWATNAGMSAIQKSASATTFCQRYALRMALGLPVGEDDDAPPDPHGNPDERTDAPKVAPRGQRAQFSLSQAELLAVKKSWRKVVGYDVPGDANSLAAAFTEWCKFATNDNSDWNPHVLGEWTKAKYETCQKKLGSERRNDQRI